MKKLLLSLIVIIMSSAFVNAQQSNFQKIDFIIGEWSGTGTGFGNSKSKIESSILFDMNDKYIEVFNESFFEPNKRNPEGEHHIDKGFISYDKSRKKIVFRQFNIEGYVNQYVMNEELSNDSTVVFETETIENFMPGGKARWTIKKMGDLEIETTFDVSFPGKEYACFGTNKLARKIIID